MAKIKVEIEIPDDGYKHCIMFDDEYRFCWLFDCYRKFNRETDNFERCDECKQA